MGRLLASIAGLLVCTFAIGSWLLGRGEPRAVAERVRDAAPAEVAEAIGATGTKAELELSDDAASAREAAHVPREGAGPAEASARLADEAPGDEAGDDADARSIVATLLNEPIYPVVLPRDAVRLESPVLDAPRAAESRPGRGEFFFSGLPSGEYTLVVDDPDFEPLELTGLHPGDRPQREVCGSASLALQVVDADSGAALERWSLTLRADGADFRPRAFELGTFEPQGEAARVAGLVPLEYTAVVTADGYPSAFTPVPKLSPREERALRIELSTRGAVSGVVLDATSGRPVAGAPVELYRADGVKGNNWWLWWGQAARKANLLVSGTSDADGRFRLPTNFAGAVTARAIGGVGVHALATVERGAFDATGVDLALPARARVLGRVLAPDWASFDGLVVRVANAKTVSVDPADTWEQPFDGFEERAVAADGSFEVDGLMPGAVRVALLLAGSSARTMVVHEMSFDAGAGPNVVELDGRERWPGDLALTVFASGASAPGLGVGGVGVDGLRVDLKSEGLWFGPLEIDPDGVLRLRAPAGSYVAKISGAGGLWSWTAPEPLVVVPGERQERTFVLPHAAGRMRVADAATGAPLAGTDVHLSLVAGDEVRRARTRTDADGELRLVLPATTLFVSRTAPPRDVDAAGLVELAELEGFARVAWPVVGPVSLAVDLR